MNVEDEINRILESVHKLNRKIGATEQKRIRYWSPPIFRAGLEERPPHFHCYYYDYCLDYGSILSTLQQGMNNLGEIDQGMVEIRYLIEKIDEKVIFSNVEDALEDLNWVRYS